MKQVLCILAMLTLSLTTTACRSTGAKELKMLAGTWQPVEAELGGQKFPDEILRTMKLTMSDDRYTVNAGGQVDSGTFKLQPSTTPKAIDITGTEGPNEGKTFLAIYQLQGDTLLVCYDLAGQQRPAEFKTAKDTQQFLVSYQREKN